MAAARDQNGRRRASKWDTPAPASSATEAAREAARKLNAMLAAKGKLTTNSTPLLLPPSNSGGRIPASTVEAFSEEIDINDSQQRLLLCKSNVQFEINKYSGAFISTKGKYIPASERGDSDGQKPLHLFIQANSRDKVNLAVQRIRAIMDGADPFTPPPIPAPQNFQAAQSSNLPAGMYYVQDKVFVGLDNVHPEFNLKENILGPGESYFHHITRETGAKVQLRGRGSGFIEPTSGREAFESLYIYISHNNYSGLGAAKKLVENLIQTVHTAYQTFHGQLSSSSYYSSYGGYPGHGSGQFANRPAHVYNMPPTPGYGAASHPGAPPLYTHYPRASSSLPPPYNYPPQSRFNSHFSSNPRVPPHTVYPDPAFRSEAPKPLMNEPLPASDDSALPYVPECPTKPDQEPARQVNRRTPGAIDHGDSMNEIDLQKRKDEPPEPPKPAKRRFTEAPAKNSALPSEELAIDTHKRYVSSLDQQSTQSSGNKVEKDTMAPPVSPAPKPKSYATDVKKETSLSSDAFKLPNNPISALASAAKKNASSTPASSQAVGMKRKFEESTDEKKSTGFALLGSYDDSSDED